jgi:type I restriction enzyme, S subunit
MNQDRSTTITNSQLKEGYKQTEIGVIPEDWSISTVGEEFSIQLGKMLDADKNIGTPKPYLGNRSIQWGHIEIEDISLISLTPSDIQRFRLKKGDLLVCEGGESGRAAIWNNQINECYYQKALHRLRPTKGYNVFLMLCFLQRWVSTGFLSDFITQTSIAHLPKEKFEQVPLLVPTLPEQETIAHTLSDIDALIESLDRLLIKKRQIKQGIMQELLRSKDGWTEKNLGEVAEFYKGKGLPKSEIIPFATYPCIHYGELFTKYPETILNVQSRTNINIGVFYSVANDVLMPTSDVTPNGLATASCILEDGVILGGDVLVIRIDPQELNGSFLSYLIRYSKKQIMQLVSGTTVYHLYGSDMRKFSFSMPTIEEQIEIANILSDMDAEIGSIESKLTKTRQLKQGMMHELLTGKIRLVSHS